MLEAAAPYVRSYDDTMQYLLQSANQAATRLPISPAPQQPAPQKQTAPTAGSRAAMDCVGGVCRFVTPAPLHPAAAHTAPARLTAMRVTDLQTRPAHPAATQKPAEIPEQPAQKPAAQPTQMQPAPARSLPAQMAALHGMDRQQPATQPKAHTAANTTAQYPAKGQATPEGRLAAAHVAELRRRLGQASTRIHAVEEQLSCQGMLVATLVETCQQHHLKVRWSQAYFPLRMCFVSKVVCLSGVGKSRHFVHAPQGYDSLPY